MTSIPKSFAKDEYDSLLITYITDLDPLFFAIIDNIVLIWSLSVTVITKSELFSFISSYKVWSRASPWKIVVFLSKPARKLHLFLSSSKIFKLISWSSCSINVDKFWPILPPPTIRTSNT